MKQELSREGHRARARQLYLRNGLDGMAEHNVLEFILFYAIPRRDVKEIAYALLNHFDGDLTRVFDAEITELQQIKGIGENAAVLLSLFREVEKLLNKKKNENVKALMDYAVSKQYAYNCLAGLKNERVIALTLNNSCELIACHTLADGTVNCTNVEPKQIVECTIRDNASSVILAHNHPNGSYLPSDEDVRFTEFIFRTLKTLNIALRDHIIVGDNGVLSMTNDTRYCHCFE